MPERPILILPASGPPVARKKKGGGAAKIHLPDKIVQAERIAPRFTSLIRTFEERRTMLRTASTGIIPEEVLVLETAGTVDDFIAAVRNISGMEWLGEIEEEDIPPDDNFFALDSKGEPKREKNLRGRVFLIFSNQQALEQMSSLWTRWKLGQEIGPGLSKWNALFSQLLDIRPWSIRDRILETGVIDDWKDRISHNQLAVPCEIELWFRKIPQLRSAAEERVTNLIRDGHGRVVGSALIPEINYHALLAELPIEIVNNIINENNQDISLFQCEKIQFFRAAGQMASVVLGDEQISDTAVPEETVPSGDPVVALFDGLPLQNHNLLLNHLIIDDPDNFETMYQASERIHGTAMASLIIHGDLDTTVRHSLSRPIYVRPILQPDTRDWNNPRYESLPENMLAVDVIHRAVRRLFEMDGNEPPVAPSVRVVNLSIGILDRLFYGSLSPLARLLDWLAWKYNLLFIVSAGNHLQQIELSMSRSNFSTLSAEEIQEAILRKIASETRHRCLLSPAEAINVITVGALHNDESSENVLTHVIDPYTDRFLPSPINAQGMGYRRAIKPDLLANGGRILLQENYSTGNAVLNIYRGSIRPGQRVARPGVAGDTTSTFYTRGTSNAAALTSRAANTLYDVLLDLQNEQGGELIDTVPFAVWLKVLLIHATEWGLAGDALERILRTPQNSRQFKEYVTRLVGYGAAEVTQVTECTAYRTTALGGGILRENESHLHLFPLPPSLSGISGWRRLKISLAWLTPINPLHQNYKRADLWFEAPKEILRVDRRQADWQAARRGTLQHEIFEGDRAAAFVDGDNIEIRVNCRAGAGALEEAIPYALAITLAVAEDLDVPIYEEIRLRVHSARIAVATSR
jgi:Subtilase family